MNHDFIHSAKMTKALTILLSILIVLLSFHIGTQVGYRRASFAYNDADRYFRAFDGMPRMGMMGPAFPDAHGAAGTIVSVTLPTILIKDNDGSEKTIIVSDQTSIRKFRDDAGADMLTPGEMVVVFGSPNEQSQIEAHLIRIIPDIRTGK